MSVILFHELEPDMHVYIQAKRKFYEDQDFKPAKILGKYEPEKLVWFCDERSYFSASYEDMWIKSERQMLTERSIVAFKGMSFFNFPPYTWEEVADKIISEEEERRGTFR